MSNRLKTFFLIIGDIAVLYVALVVALIIRYGDGFQRGGFYDQLVNTHLMPFSVIFVPWLIIFYIAGLYDLRRLRNNIDFLKILGTSIVINAFVAILLFYLVPLFGIAPKTNLFIFFAVFAIIEIAWRRLFNRAASGGEAPNKVLLIGDGASEKIADEIEKTVRENSQLGYAIAARMAEDAIGNTTTPDAPDAPDALDKMVTAHEINLVVVPSRLKYESKFAAALYKLLGRGISITDLAAFYETIMRKVPLADVGEAWFLENIEGTARFYDPLKRAAEFLEALILMIILLPLEILIALVVKLTSPGPVIYRQVRVGKNGSEFMLYKFRTMRADAERNGAQWAAGASDPRITPFGRLLRATHFDELPQLLNILRGEISFVGPRPERPEFVAQLKREIPFYEVRLLVTPGITGWAQINHRADRGLDDVREKLQYDIYYLKNRSLVLDVAIVLKTVKSVFVNQK